MVFVQVKTAGNQADLQNYVFYSSSAQAFVTSIPLDPTKCPLRLDASVHPQQCAMNAVQVLQNLFVELGQLFVDPHDTVFNALVALLPVRTSFAVFTLIIFLGATVPSIIQDFAFYF